MSGFTSILKQIGLDIAKGVKAVISGPTVIIQDATEKISDIKQLVDIVKMAEGMWAAAGAQSAGSQKLAAVTPYVTSIIGDVEVVAGAKIGSLIKDQAGFTAGVQNLISALVQILNSCGH